MKALKIIGLLLIIVAGAALTFYAYMGGLKAVKIEKSTFNATEVIYSTHVGPYEKLSESWDPFLKKLRETGLDDCDSYGLYFDPPETPPEELRSIIACSTDGITPELKKSLKEQFPSFILPKSEAYSTTFSFKNNYSFYLASYSVYPKFQELIKSGELNPSLSIEHYGLDESRTEIVFYMPTDKNEEDYKPLIDAFK